MCRSRIRTLLVLIAVLVTSGALPRVQAAGVGSAASDWPMYQGDAARTGRSSFAGIETRPYLRWKRILPGIGAGATPNGMSIGPDGSVYLTTQGDLFSVHPVRAITHWHREGGGYSSATPALATKRLYWATDLFFAAFTLHGRRVSDPVSFGSALGFKSSPAIAPDGSVYIVKHGLAKFTPEGALVWYYPLHWLSHKSPAIGPDGTIYTSAGDGHLYAIGPDGVLKWKTPTSIGADVASPSVGADGTIYIGSSTGHLYAYKPNGKVTWRFKARELGGSIAAPPAIGSDGTLYFGVHASGYLEKFTHVYAVRPDGTLKWAHRIPGGPYNYPAIVTPMVVDRDDRSYVCADNGSCYGFSPRGTLLWEYVISGTAWNRTAPLIVADGMMLILDEDGRLHSLRNR